jgi:hypothetical protein
MPATGLNFVGSSAYQGTTDGTFPYDGGPQNGYVAPGLNPAALMALVLTLALMAIALNELVRLVEARFSRWKD